MTAVNKVLDEKELTQAVKEYMENYYPDWLNKRVKLEWIVEGDVFTTIKLEIKEATDLNKSNKSSGE